MEAQRMDVGDPGTTFAENLRRLIFFHHKSAKEAAELLGVSQHALSAWVTGKRPPRTQHLLGTALLYNFDLGALTSESLVAFARELARPLRIVVAEAQIARRRAMMTGEGLEEAESRLHALSRMAADQQKEPRSPASQWEEGRWVPSTRDDLLGVEETTLSKSTTSKRAEGDG